jgi:signal transduction histidine kinase
LSARAGEESRIQGLEGGADDYLVKPFSARELVARANSAIRLAQLRAQVAQQDERVRIARDLHDTLLQSVQGMSFLLAAGLQKFASDEDSALGFFRNAMQAATQAVAEGREVLSLLRSSAPERYDLTEGLRRLGRELLHGTPMRFSINVEGRRRELRPRAWAEAYAICREALSNAARHAHAHSSVLKVSYLHDFEVVISDDGKGMSARMISNGRESHFGLKGMRERAANLGARLAVESGRGAGTTVMLTIPGNVAYA